MCLISGCNVERRIHRSVPVSREVAARARALVLPKDLVDGKGSFFNRNIKNQIAETSLNYRETIYHSFKQQYFHSNLNRALLVFLFFSFFSFFADMLLLLQEHHVRVHPLLLRGIYVVLRRARVQRLVPVALQRLVHVPSGDRVGRVRPGCLRSLLPKGA